MISVIGKGVIRVYSDMNYFLDCIYIVSEKNEEKAVAVLKKAYEAFWEDEEHSQDYYGDLFEETLCENCIEFEAFYTKDED